MLGIAMGAIGLRLAEFEVLTPSQFDVIYRHWRQRQDDLSHERWEIARLTSMYAIAPYTKKKLKPVDLLRFPWEKEAADQERKPVEKSTKERFEEIKERWK